MKLLQKARFQLANFISPRVTQAIKNKFNEAFLWGGSFTQYDVKARTYLEQGYNYNPIVYSIINQQATKTASIPYYIKKIENKTAQRKLKRLQLVTKGDYSVQQQVRMMLLENKAFADADLPFPMAVPNISQTWTEWIALYKTFLKLTGNVFIFIMAPEDGPNKGVPLQVYILPSHMTQIVLKQKPDMLGVDSPIKNYILTHGRSFIEFAAENVIHIKYSNPNFGENGEHLYGQSPLRAALRNIQDSNYALDLNIKTLKSGGAFGLIHGKNTVTGQTALTVDQAAEIKERLLEMDASSENLSKIAGVSAEVGFTRLSLTSAELKPFDYLKFDKQQIAEVLNWSIDDENRGDFGGTINEIKKSRITDNIQPDLELLADALNTEFLPRFKNYDGHIIFFDFMELPEMQTDTKKLMDWLLPALKEGVVHRDEVRIAINYPATGLKEMETFTVNTDILSLDEALEADFTINNS